MAQTPSADLSFTDAFPAADEARWRKLVEGVLKGGAFEKLIGQTYEGIAIQPLYGRATAETPRALRAEAGDWTLCARVDNPDAKAANAQALTDLQNGANGLQLVFAGAQGAYGFGLKDGSRATVDAVLDQVILETGIRIEVDLSLACKDAAESIAARVEAAKVDPAQTNISFGFDPLGQIALNGPASGAWADIAPDFGKLAKSFAGRGFKGQIAAADARIVSAAGGSAAQELAFAVASGLAYLRALEGAGVPLDDARGMIGFRLAADADEFMSLAKFRALRRLWAQVEAACGLTPAPIRVHGETAWRMMTRRDPWVNLLRTTVAVFSAGLGGADSVSVLPFTQAIGLPDEFARRIARNTQLVLLEESNLGKVADPAAGAGGFETLTDELAQRGWSLFQSIEAEGGLGAALASGSLRGAVEEIAKARAKAIGRRKDPLTGASEFPDVHEKAVHVLAPAPKAETPAGAFVQHRLAEAFEALRDAADARDVKPKIFLANLGPIAAFTARAMFAKNFFEAGGVEAPGNDGFADAASMADAFKASGAKIACICSSDAVYAEQAEAAAKALKGAGAARVYLAGRPGDLEAGLKAAGVDEFVFVGSDVLAALAGAHKAA
mgnify:CR=1 FL=1